MYIDMHLVYVYIYIDRESERQIGPSQTCIHGTHMYMHVHTRIYTYIPTYADMYTFTYMHTCMHAYIHTYLLTFRTLPESSRPSEGRRDMRQAVKSPGLRHTTFGYSRKRCHPGPKSSSVLRSQPPLPVSSCSKVLARLGLKSSGWFESTIAVKTCDTILLHRRSLWSFVRATPVYGMRFRRQQNAMCPDPGVRSMMAQAFT